MVNPEENPKFDKNEPKVSPLDWSVEFRIFAKSEFEFACSTEAAFGKAATVLLTSLLTIVICFWPACLSAKSKIGVSKHTTRKMNASAATARGE